MKRILSFGCVVLLAGCAKANNENVNAMDTTTTATTTAAAPAPAAPQISLDSVAGTCHMKAKKEGSDSVILTYDLVASTDTTKWQFKFPNNPVPAHVLSVAGDSIVVHAGPYKSALRKNVMVTTHSIMRLQNGMLVGNTVAHYSAGPDTVVNIRSEGTRAK
jgi:hypothetical protein